MAGLYIHIPFCKSRCIYCAFFSSTAAELRQPYVDALCSEISFRPAPPLATIYLGGGTPSRLSVPQLRQLFASIYTIYKVEPDAEVTVEVNPDDVTPELAAALADLPVNRVSMGAQTFSDSRLAFLRRRHSARQVARAVAALRSAGIPNLSIDLMFGFPGETLPQWQSDIRSALSLQPEHISAYCLTVEQGTPLSRMLFPPADEELQHAMYDTLIDTLQSGGYDHYEISSFAQPGFRSRHNSAYWSGEPYIGIGAAAHSYDIRSRSWNVSDLRTYIEAVRQGRRPFEEEILDDDTRYNDTVTVSLRRREGIPLQALSDRHRHHCLRSARPFIDSGLLRLSPDRASLALTRRGLFVSDMIMSELMLV